MSNINIAEAKRLAEQCLDDDSMRIDDRHTVEHDFGWVFVAETLLFLDTGDEKDRAVGVGPIVVARDTGEAICLPTFRPPEIGVRDFADQWRRRQSQ